MEATIEKREAVGLTERNMKPEVSLTALYNRLDDTGKFIAIAYLEGMAAASAPKEPKPLATA